MLPTVEEIIEIFQRGDQEEILAFVESCSIAQYKDQAKQAIQIESTPETTYKSMVLLTLGCLDSEQYMLAERVAESCYLLARSSFELNLGDTVSLRLIAGRAALNWMTALQYQEDYKQINNLIDEPLSWLKAIGDADNFDLLRLKKVESLLDHEKYTEAKKSFKEITESKLTAIAQVHYRTIEYRIRTRKGKKVQLPIDFNDPEKNEEGSRHYYKDLKDVTGETVRKKIIEASYLLADPRKGTNPAEIVKVEPDLILGRDWMRDNHFPVTENDACWSLYLAYNRTNREELAVEQLQRIRSNIENARSSISDPGGRARLVERFPYLYPCICTLFYKLGRYEELMEVIEASKSRTLADFSTQKTGNPVSERELAKVIKELPGVLGRLNSHYYTCFVDDDCVYCVLLTSKGITRAAKVEIKKERVEYYGSISSPRLWGQPDPIDPIRRRIPEDLPQKLSPFIDLFKTLLENHEIEEGDHICYSSHDALLNIPFQYLNFYGKQLADFFSLSRIPGAYTLQQILIKNTHVPEKYTHIEVPFIQDLNDRKKLKALKEPGQWLDDHISDGTRLNGEEADLDALADADLEGRILHFSTHGRFPDDKLEIDPNPNKSSGLVLAANNKLPDLDLIRKGRGEEHILTPEKTLNSAISFSNSHITLQACVCAPAKRGLKGDPPGLEWAFLQNGATSILSANWQTSSQTATHFIKTFYEHWLEKGTSRAEAWHNTVLELKDNDSTSHPYHWAAFSLIGDWR